jgi:hypothetical protein
MVKSYRDLRSGPMIRISYIEFLVEGNRIILVNVGKHDEVY